MKPFILNLSFISIIFFFGMSSCDSQKDPIENNSLSKKLPTNLIERPKSLKSDTNAMLSLGNMQFEDTLHHFGRIHEGEVLSYDFSFVNSGNKDLLISEAKASCGCTVPEYPHQPIRKGEKGTVKVTFNSQGKYGFNEKSIILYTNGYPSSYTLYIQAEVGDAQ